MQAFVAESASSLLSKVPRKILKDVSALGSYKAAFDLKRNPSFTGLNEILNNKAKQDPNQILNHFTSDNFINNC